MWQKQQKSIAYRGSCDDMKLTHEHWTSLAKQAPHSSGVSDCIHILYVVWKWHIWFLRIFLAFLLVLNEGNIFFCF